MKENKREEDEKIVIMLSLLESLDGA